MAENDKGSGAVSSTDDKRAQLEAKLAEATSRYAHKNYVQAAELYSEATELQDELNGEMHPDNAYLLYLYGRCLYHVAVSKSDVLGGKAAVENTQDSTGNTQNKKRKAEASNGEGSSAQGAAVSDADTLPEDDVRKNQPNFQIEGDDADWDDELQQEDESEDSADDVDEDEGGKNADDEEEEDDFALAYEVLDIARVLLTRQIEVKRQDAGKEKEITNIPTNPSTSSAIEPPKTLYAVRELLADTHDLQAEICLENERFEDAIADSTASLALKQELYPQESSLVAEAHYKLSLALEFASVTKAEAEQVDVGMIASVLGGEGSGQGTEKTQEDDQAQKEKEEKRSKAAEHMEAAIESSKLRVKHEREELGGLTAGSEDAKKKQKEIKEVEEIIGDMEQRLLDLKGPPPPTQESLNPSSAAGAQIGGILGSLMGQAPTAQKAILEQAMKGANDLSGMVKRKRKEDPHQGNESGASGAEEKEKNGTSAHATNGKRKMLDVGVEAEDESDASTVSKTKKVRIADDA